MNEKETGTIRVDKKLIKELKVFAAKRDIKMKDFVEQAIMDAINRYKSPSF